MKIKCNHCNGTGAIDLDEMRKKGFIPDYNFSGGFSLWPIPYNCPQKMPNDSDCGMCPFTRCPFDKDGNLIKSPYEE